MIMQLNEGVETDKTSVLECVLNLMNSIYLK